MGNFEEHLTSDLSVPWFVLFYVPKCAHCKKMASDFQDFAVRPSLQTAGVRVGKVNAEKDEELSAKWVSVGFPTMELFVEGRPIQYEGERSADAMEAWVLANIPSQSLLHRVSRSMIRRLRILGVDPALPGGFALGMLAALLLWCIGGGRQKATNVDQSNLAKKPDSADNACKQAGATSNESTE